ncbi:MAG: PQQ-binding-like beta-propeller repeat protein [Rhodospirillales bacterium]|nr:PQQ-binding-like beta-propeller repeat protein [Alphaproteobacteria bacterium]MCB9977045.1 PQQ-binding-like beta-propeller repeat protein [Rhodospirillales bacterium]
MNRIKNTLLFVSMTLLMAGCSKVTSVFDSDADKPKLEGERISVLELQKTLEPEGEKHELLAPDPWNNAFWPQAGGYPNHSMQNPALGKEPGRAWKTSIGSGSGSLPLTAQPVIAEGRVYTLDTDSSLRAFDIQSGKKLWETSVENDEEDEDVLSGGVSYSDGFLFVTNGYDEVLKIKAADGSITWRKNIPAPSRAAPTVIDNKIYLITLDNRVLALDENTGDTLWAYVGIVETAGLLGAASPAANSDIVVAVFSSGEVTALRVENGSVAWSDNISSARQYGGGIESLSDIKALPVLDHGLVIILSFGGKLVAFDQTSGARVWQREIGGAETPWVAGNFLFVLSNDQQLIALSLEDGRIIWVTPLPRYENEKKKSDPILWKGPVMGSGRLILSGTDGNMIEVNATNGKILGRWDSDRTPAVPPAIAANTLLLLSTNGELAAYR